MSKSKKIAVDQFLQGHVLDVLRTLPDGCVQCCVTSPPYWGLRVYSGEQEQIWLDGNSPCQEHVWEDDVYLSPQSGGTGEASAYRNPKYLSAGVRHVSKSNFCTVCGAWRGGLGLEPTIDLYVQHIVEVFREVKRILRDDGTLWLNMGDSYASGKGSCHNPGGGENSLGQARKTAGAHPLHRGNLSELHADGLKPKDLCGIPWRVAFALQAEGWYLRSDIIWSKKNPMPESVTDRPTRSHEYVFLLSKSKHYFYDADAVREPHITDAVNKLRDKSIEPYNVSFPGGHFSPGARAEGHVSGRNLRSVWHLATQPFSGAHFATFPEKLVEKCVLAGTSPKACEHCGAPWARVVKKTESPHDGTTETLYPPGSAGRRMSLARQAARERGGEYEHNTETLGFRPSCSCEDKTGTGRCLVLDPFMGSGTVACVAARYGRSFVGIDVAYQEMARRRIARVQPLLPIVNPSTVLGEQ